MKHFFTLAEFEYRKLWKRKSAILAMSVGLLVSILSVWGTLLGSTYINGKVSESNYEATFKDLQYAKDLNGRTLDTALLLEAAHAYAQIPPNTEIPYIGLEEYETYARPYSSIYGIAGRLYRASGEEFSYEEMAALTKRDANHFYEKRASLLKNTIANTTMSQTAKEHTLKTAEKVQTPFTYSNSFRFFLWYAVRLCCLWHTEVFSVMKSHNFLLHRIWKSPIIWFEFIITDLLLD